MISPQRLAQRLPHRRPMLRTNTRNRRILEYPPLEELHDVEGRANHAVVFAEADGAGHGDVGARHGGYDAVLAVDLVGGAGEDLARGFLAHHVFLARGGGELVGGVGLAIAELST